MSRYFFMSYSCVLFGKHTKGSLSFGTSKGFPIEDEVKKVIQAKYPNIDGGTIEINTIFEFTNKEDFERFQS